MLTSLLLGFCLLVEHSSCGDIMYSGHTAGITLCTMLWTHYSKGEEWKPCCGDDRPFITPNLDAVGDPATCSLTAVVAWVVAFGGFFFIIATHFHYVSATQRTQARRTDAWRSSFEPRVI